MMAKVQGEIPKEIAHAWSEIDTGTLRDLSAASCKLYQELSHGKIYAYIDSASAFLQTAAFSVVRLVCHVALAAISVAGIWSTSGRNFLKENLIRSCIDLTGVVVGLIGTPLPHVALYATALEIKILNSFLVNHEIVPKDIDEKKEFVSPIWITRYLYQYMQRSTWQIGLSYGGEKNLVTERKV